MHHLEPLGRGGAVKMFSQSTLIQSVTEVIVEQPLASPGSAKYPLHTCIISNIWYCTKFLSFRRCNFYAGMISAKINFQQSLFNLQELDSKKKKKKTANIPKKYSTKGPHSMFFYKMYLIGIKVCMFNQKIYTNPNWFSLVEICYLQDFCVWTKFSLF